MIRVIALLAAVGALAAGCQSDHGISTTTADPEASESVAVGVPTTAEETTAAVLPRRTTSLSAIERRRISLIASRLDRAIERFDHTVEACRGVSRAACIDRAWSVIVPDAEWPLYYLVRMRPRARGCDALWAAMAELDGFNLAGRQVDYGPPGEAGASRTNERLTVVDTLRPIPSELRAAAAAACR